ncbi:MAG: hypothetical protein KBC30_08625 [Planctomycetes bacterium]|nr:hypothetical protein [Planctomycetota bacterium]
MLWGDSLLWGVKVALGREFEVALGREVALGSVICSEGEFALGWEIFSMCGGK